MSSGGTQPRAQHACNALNSGITVVWRTEWEVTVVSEALSSRGCSPPSRSYLYRHPGLTVGAEQRQRGTAQLYCW